ncbi:MAG: hypothetical protein PWR24_1388 [Desulfonauticus sp.]|nr:hypothetical protein [Desulfonauticus sp.]
MDWNAFFDTYAVEEKYLSQAYERVGDKKRAFFKKQIYELTEYYQYLKELKLSVCKKNYSLFELEEGFSPKKEVIFLVEEGFFAVNQILALFIPLLLAGVEKIGVVLLGSKTKIKAEIFVGLELAGGYYLAWGKKKRVIEFLNCQQRPVFYFGFNPRWLKSVFWQTPLTRGVIWEEQEKINLENLLWANPHTTFYASWGKEDAPVKPLEERERDFFLEIGSQKTSFAKLTLAPGEETSWIWPDFNWTWAFEKYVFISRRS